MCCVDIFFQFFHFVLADFAFFFENIHIFDCEIKLKNKLFFIETCICHCAAALGACSRRRLASSSRIRSFLGEFSFRKLIKGRKQNMAERSVCWPCWVQSQHAWPDLRHWHWSSQTTPACVAGPVKPSGKKKGTGRLRDQKLERKLIKTPTSDERAEPVGSETWQRHRERESTSDKATFNSATRLPTLLAVACGLLVIAWLRKPICCGLFVVLLAGNRR